MPMLMFLDATASAGTADSFAATITSGQQQQIVPFERMPVLAANLACVHCCRADSAEGILPLGYWLEMVRVHTSTVAARVIKVLTRFQRSDKRDISQSVRTSVLALKPVIAVAALDRRRPVPASVRSLFDLAPEAFPKVHNRIPFYRVES